MKRIILTAVLLALAVVLSSCTAANPPAATEAPAATVTEAPTTTEAPVAEPAETGAPAETEAPAAEQSFLLQITADDPSIAYVLVRLTESYGFLPLPQEGEYQKTIRQIAPDGSEYVNVLHVTPEGFYMEESNCEGHDCIGEGEVTLSNREERPLWNMVICLPHRLSAELITRAEAEQLLGIQPSGN